MAEQPKQAIGVIGAGTMGAGIAQVAAQSGYPVVLYDIQQDFVDRGLGGIRKALQGRVDKGKLAAEEMAATLARIQPATERDALAPAAVIIEAAPESLALKSELFQALDKLCGPDTILASNTSSLSITALGTAAGRPERVVGMHFFNPAPVMALVEVIAGARTDPAVAASVTALA